MKGIFVNHTITEWKFLQISRVIVCMILLLYTNLTMMCPFCSRKGAGYNMYQIPPPQHFPHPVFTKGVVFVGPECQQLLHLHLSVNIQVLDDISNLLQCGGGRVWPVNEHTSVITYKRGSTNTTYLCMTMTETLSFLLEPWNWDNQWNRGWICVPRIPVQSRQKIPWKISQTCTYYAPDCTHQIWFIRGVKRSQPEKYPHQEQQQQCRTRWIPTHHRAYWGCPW